MQVSTSDSCHVKLLYLLLPATRSVAAINLLRIDWNRWIE